MAVSISGAQLQTKVSFGSVETLTQSTATAIQELDLRQEVTILGMGTATGFLVNRYALPTPTAEGMEKLIVTQATGEAKVFVGLPSGRIGVVGSSLAAPAATSVDAMWASATGLWVFQSSGDFLLLRAVDGAWAILHGSGATLATAT